MTFERLLLALLLAGLAIGAAFIASIAMHSMKAVGF